MSTRSTTPPTPTSPRKPADSLLVGRWEAEAAVRTYRLTGRDREKALLAAKRFPDLEAALATKGDDDD